MLTDADARVLLTDRDPGHLPPDHHLAVVRLDAEAEAIGQEPDAMPISAANADNLAYVIYTRVDPAPGRGGPRTVRSTVLSSARTTCSSDRPR